MEDKNTATFAIAAIVKNEASYIEEWIAFHAISGASFIRLYDNESVDETVILANKMSSVVPVEIVNWPDTFNDFNLTQKSAYWDANNYFKNKVDFVAFIDIDEFLVADVGTTISHVLGSLDKSIGAIACQQLVFGSSGWVEHRSGLVIDRFRACADDCDPDCLWFKTIARPLTVTRIETVHSVSTTGHYSFVDGSPIEFSNESKKAATRIVHHPLKIHHYMLKSFEEFRKKQQRMLAARFPVQIKENYKTENFFSRDLRFNVNNNFVLESIIERVRDCIKLCRNS